MLPKTGSASIGYGSRMETSRILSAAFASAAPYSDHLAAGTPAQQDAWRQIFDRAHLTPDQQRLVAGFSREMHVLAISGVWCGDCAQQCPLLQRIAEASPDRIKLRFIARAAGAPQPDLGLPLRINGGDRVPVVIFLAEDDEFVSIYGDRTLSRYRALAARQLGPACPLPGAPIPDDEIAATLQDWLNEFERVQLLLRLSGRLRQKYGD